MLDLKIEIGQGHTGIMFYTNFVELHCLMFQNHRPSGSSDEVVRIYSHGDHLGHVTWTIYITCRSHFLRMLHIKFGFDCPSGFRGEGL